MTRFRLAAIAAIAVGIAIPQSLSAQDAAAPCTVSPCVFDLDWGNGKTSASYVADRRYGSGDDFEARFRAAMAAHGYRFTDIATEGAMRLRVRPMMKERVSCDRVSGLNPDMSCTAMTNLAVTFAPGDPNVKAPGAIGINNRCGSSGQFLTMKAFAEYASDMVWWQLEGQAAKADRPTSKC